MSEKRRAPTEVLERLAEAVDEHARINDPGGTSPSRYREQLAAYRAAVAPLRTRAEVDAEIVATVRAKDGWHNSARLCELISEPTAMNSGPSSADTEEVPSPRPPVSPAGADYSVCDACDGHIAHRCVCEWCSRWSCWKCERRGTVHRSGPAGVAAAKESKDNAAAPEGATNDCECNCDQALHLERRIGDAVRAIRRSSTIPAGLLHELLGILEGEA